MTTNFDDVGDFHAKFGLDSVTRNGSGPREVPDDLLEFRIGFLKEELREFEEACALGDEPGKADALIDLAYVVFGTAQLLGYPWQELWEEVQAANMRKERAERADQSMRGSTWDVVKPHDWTPPEIEGILKHHGW
jgi:predicted HAD superfamily Cof-like phosphohydrolase